MWRAAFCALKYELSSYLTDSFINRFDPAGRKHALARPHQRRDTRRT